MSATPSGATNYDLLAAFVAVAQEASFSKAARRLGVTKGTVSRAVARLERALDVELLHRTTHKVALSTVGTALYERTAPHVAALERALGALPERGDQPSGELRITAPHDFAAIVLPELLAQFSVRYPDISFDVRVTNASVDVGGEGFDLAIRAAAGKLRDSALKARRLGSGIVGFYASPAYLARRGEPRAFGDPRHEWIVLPAALSLLMPPKGFQPRMIVDDILTIRGLLRQGAGIGLLPRFVAAEDVAAGILKPTRPTRPLGASGLYLVYPSSGQVPRKVSAFRDFVVERLEARLRSPD